MANTLTFNATKSNTTRDIEYLHPNTNSWQSSPVVTGVLAGTYSDLKARLRGAGPSVIATYNQPVTVSDPSGSNSPTITSFTPTTAPIGGNITVTGTNLLNITSVVIGGVQAAIPSSMGGTAVPGQQVILLIPNGAISNMPISITTDQGTATSAQVLLISAILPSPSNGTAMPDGDSTLQITADTVPNATGYQLFASDTSGSSFSQIGNTLLTPSYQETNLGYNHTRYYRWKAVGNGDNYVNSPLSAEFSGTTTSGQGSSDAPTITSVPTTEKKFGDFIIINGTNFIGTTSITINNIPVKSYVVNSSTQVTAIISTAQTTGLLTLTTAIGSATSSTSILIAPATVNKGITRLDVTVDFAAINKDTKTTCNLEFSNGYGSNYSNIHLYKGTSTIKYRGNSTAVLPKKPFSLTFTKADGSDQKFPALGMYNDSDFILLAEYQDASYERTYISHEISRGMGLITVNTRPTEVYINGEYYGLYTITEKIKQALIGLESLTTADADQTLPNIDGGYLIEKVIDNQEDLTQLTSFKTTYYGDFYQDIRMGPTAHSISVEYPKFGKITPTQTNYIKQVILDAESTLTNGWLDLDFGPQTKFDKESLLRYYMVSEFCQSVDAENHSSYLYKRRGGKLMHGPLWDMDISFLTYTYYKFLDDHATANFIWESNGWANKLFGDRYFINDLSKLYVSTAKAVFQNALILIDARSALLVDSGAIDRNNNKWNVNTTDYVIPITTNTKTNNYMDHVNLLKDFITRRIAHFDTTYVPLDLIGTPLGGYDIEMLDYDGNPRSYVLKQNPEVITVFMVLNMEPGDRSTQSAFVIGSDQPRGTSLIYETNYGFGLNTFTPSDDTFDDLTIFDSGKYRLIEATIYSNDTTKFSMFLNGQALPHSVKPAGSTLDGKILTTNLSFGLIGTDLPQLNWKRDIKAGYVYRKDLSSTDREYQRNFIRNNFAEVTQ